jgi:hypothetical protein
LLIDQYLLLGTAAFTRTKLQKFWVYARVEFKPPTPSEFPEISQRFSNILVSAQTGKWQKLTTRVSFYFIIVNIYIKPI